MKLMHDKRDTDTSARPTDPRPRVSYSQSCKQRTRGRTGTGDRGTNQRRERRLRHGGETKAGRLAARNAEETLLGSTYRNATHHSAHGASNIKGDIDVPSPTVGVSGIVWDGFIARSEAMRAWVRSWARATRRAERQDLSLEANRMALGPQK